MIQLNRTMVLVLGLMLAPTLFADGQVESDYRQAVMKSIGGHMSAMATIVKKQVHLDNLALHARGIETLSHVAPTVFPDGSNVEKSKALPGVWEDREAFDEAMNRFVKAAKEMPAAAESGDMSQIGPAINALGGSCKGCHDDFKAES